MNKFEIMNDIKFKQSCGDYGVDYNNFEVYDDVILVYTPIENLYIMLECDKYNGKK